MLSITAGGNGTCVTKAYSTQVKEGLTVFITVCLAKSSSIAYYKTSKLGTA